jgi:hypothetical protein
MTVPIPLAFASDTTWNAGASAADLAVQRRIARVIATALGGTVTVYK